MTAPLFLGIDLGTTGIKVGLFDAAGTIVAEASREIRLDAPQPDFLEFDAEQYEALACEAVREVLSSADAAAVQAVGISSQAQTFVVTDAAGRPLRPAVSWLDVRARAETDELCAIADRLNHTTMNAVQSAPKVLWLRRHEPAVAERMRRLLVIPDYLVFHLTGRAVTDGVFASSTGLYSGFERRWVPDLVAATGLDESMLPEVARPGTPVGTLTAEAAGRLGLPESVIVAVGTNDQPCGALGAGNVTPGCASLAMGTALAIILTADTRDGAPRGVGVSHHPASTDAAPLFALLAYAKTCGVVIRWLRDLAAPGGSYDDLFAEAAAVPIGAEGLSCVPHFSGTATPDFNARVRGAFVGLTLAHGRAHLLRALIESLAFTVRQNMDLLRQAFPANEIRAIGGGARSDLWLQMIADVTGLPVARPRTREAACLGAAELGMVAAGRFDSVAEASAAIYESERRFDPDPSTAYDEAFHRYEEVFRSLYGENR